MDADINTLPYLNLRFVTHTDYINNAEYYVRNNISVIVLNGPGPRPIADMAFRPTVNQSLVRCLGCNRNTENGFVKGKINLERTCAICLELGDVCYGCRLCMERNLPSCCGECYRQMSNR